MPQKTEASQAEPVKEVQPSSSTNKVGHRETILQQRQNLGGGANINLGPRYNPSEVRQVFHEPKSDGQDVEVEQIANLESTNDYSDLSIMCAEHVWKVHRMVVCTRSEYFKKKCQANTEQGKPMSIDLSALGPMVVEQLVKYLYTLNYSDGSQAPTEIQVRENKPLTLNHKMFVAGMLYSMPSLKDLAHTKFGDAVQYCWDKENLEDLIEMLYDKKWYGAGIDLRRLLTPICIWHYQELRARPAFRTVLRSYPDFAVDLLDYQYAHGHVEEGY
ncbi:MAG: hypothetical protein LQ348_003835 [Seirophora lacunosa]|nr:MAG: hypothetical protein LQ348_003835 [Seirophora lacunosa]